LTGNCVSFLAAATTTHSVAQQVKSSHQEQLVKPKEPRAATEKKEQLANCEL